jgi:hypothetical protein
MLGRFTEERKVRFPRWSRRVVNADSNDGHARAFSRPDHSYA